MAFAQPSPLAHARAKRPAHSLTYAFDSVPYFLNAQWSIAGARIESVDDGAFGRPCCIAITDVVRNKRLVVQCVSEEEKAK